MDFPIRKALEHHAYSSVPEGSGRFASGARLDLVSIGAAASIILHNYATATRQSDAAGERPAEFVHGLAGDVRPWRRSSRRVPARAATASRSPGGPARPPSIRSAALDPRERAMLAFRHWNPAAGFFHTATKNVPFTSRRLAEAALLRQAGTWPMPAASKRLRRSPVVPLPDIQRAGQFPDVLLTRRTWRLFFHPTRGWQRSVDRAGTAGRHPAMGANERGKDGVEDIPLGRRPTSDRMLRVCTTRHGRPSRPVPLRI